MTSSWKSLGSLVAVAACASIAMAAAMNGCGGGGSSTPITLADFCQQKAEKECVVTSRCASDANACKVQRAAACMTFANNAIVAPRVFHPENINNCLNQTTAVYTKSTVILPTDLAKMDDACNWVIQGDRKMLEPCTVKYDCASQNNICDKGKCATMSTKNKGDQCGNLGEVCASGSYCMQDTGGAFTCVAKAAQSAACNATVPCLENLHCDATNTCQPRVTTGACTTSDDCAASVPYCDPYVGGRCDMGRTFGGGAAACVDYGGSASTGVGGSPGGGTGGSTGGNDAAAGG